jgi:hypothetical protein
MTFESTPNVTIELACYVARHPMRFDLVLCQVVDMLRQLDLTGSKYHYSPLSLLLQMHWTATCPQNIHTISPHATPS